MGEPSASSNQRSSEGSGYGKGNKLQSRLLAQQLHFKDKLGMLVKKDNHASRLKLASIGGNSWTLSHSQEDAALAGPASAPVGLGFSESTGGKTSQSVEMNKIINNNKIDETKDEIDFENDGNAEGAGHQTLKSKKSNSPPPPSKSSEKEGQYSLLTKDNTWQQIGRNEPILEKPASRRDILLLQKQFQRAMHASQREIRQTRKAGSGLMAESRMEQDIIATKEMVRELLEPSKTISSGHGTNVVESGALGELEKEELKELQLRPGTEAGQRATELQNTLVAALYEQKWTDLVFGELQQLVTVSCLEQGNLLLKLRNQLASCFALMCTAHSMTVADLGEMTRRMQFFKRKACELTAYQNTIRQELGRQHELEKVKLKEEATDKYHEYEQEVKVAQASQKRMSDTLTALNAVYKKMREDADVLRAMDLTDACSLLEKKLKKAMNELDELRPLVKEKENLEDTVSRQQDTIGSLEERIKELESELSQRESLVEEVMKKKVGELSLAELEAENGATGAKRASSEEYGFNDAEEEEDDEEEEEDDEEDEEDDEEDEEESGENNTTLQDSGDQAVPPGEDAVDGKANKKVKKKGKKKKGKRKLKKKKKKNPADKFLVGKKINKLKDTADVGDYPAKNSEMGPSSAGVIREGMDEPSEAKTFLCPRCNVCLDRAGNIDESQVAGKPRVQCAGYRMLLPNLMGYRPDQPRQWILRCVRSIIRAKRRADFTADREGRARMRFPEFVYTWFTPRPERIADLRANEGAEAAMLAQAGADENRWALYYGVKKLFNELPEMRMFYTFLDERFGEDDFAFYLHCLTIMEAVANEKRAPFEWGEHTDACDFDAYEALLETQGEGEDVEDFLFMEIKHCVIAVERVMARSGPDDVARAAKTLLENAVLEEIRITPSTGQRIIDINVALRVLMQEYRDEQAHRRAALRLMFGCAGSGPGEEQSTNKTVDLGQMLKIVQSLNSKAGRAEAVTIYRLAHEMGNGKVTLDSFTDAANRTHFLSDCLRLPSHFGTEAANKLNPLQCAQIGAMIRQQFALMQSLVEKLDVGLDPHARRRLARLREDVAVELERPCVVLDGRRALCALRRLIFFLIGERNGRRELYGEQEENPELSVINARREIESLTTILADFKVDERKERMDLLQTKNSATLIQRKWRRRQEDSSAVPLRMRQFLSASFEPGLILPANMLEVALARLAPVQADAIEDAKPEGNGNANQQIVVVKRRLPRAPVQSKEWTLLLLDEIFRYKIMADARLSASQASKGLTDRGTFRATHGIKLEDAIHSVAISFLGVPCLAERLVHDFFANVHRYASTDVRLRTFARMTGVRTRALRPPVRKSALDASQDEGEDADFDLDNDICYGLERDWSHEPLTKLLPQSLEHPGAADTYAAALALFVDQVRDPAPLWPEYDEHLGIARVPVATAIAVVKKLFQGDKAFGRHAPCGRNAAPRVADECLTRMERLEIEKGKVDMDRVLLIVLQGWHSEQILRRRAMAERIKVLHAPVDFDVDGQEETAVVNHIVSFHEFADSCAPLLDATMPSTPFAMMELYRTLQYSADPSPELSYEKTIEVLQNERLFSWAATVTTVGLSKNNGPVELALPQCAGAQQRWQLLVDYWTPLASTITESIEALVKDLQSRKGIITKDDLERQQQISYRQHLANQLKNSLEMLQESYAGIATKETRSLDMDVNPCWRLLRTFLATLQKARAQTLQATVPLKDQFDVDKLKGKGANKKSKKGKKKKRT